MSRRCARAGCKTILSQYNPDQECFLHAEPRWGRASSRRNLEELEGKHPEDLRYEDRDLIWQRYQLSLRNRPPRDLMEA